MGWDATSLVEHQKRACRPKGLGSLAGALPQRPAEEILLDDLTGPGPQNQGKLRRHSVRSRLTRLARGGCRLPGGRGREAGTAKKRLEESRRLHAVVQLGQQGLLSRAQSAQSG